MIHCTVHEPAEVAADSVARADAVRMVKEGIAWWALLFPALWLLYHRLWLALIGYLVLVTVIETALAYAGYWEVATWCALAFNVLLAFEANNLRRWTLDRKGYVMTGAVSGRDLEECELKYFSEWPGDQAGMTFPATAPRQEGQTRPGASPSGDEDVIGLFPEPGR